VQLRSIILAHLFQRIRAPEERVQQVAQRIVLVTATSQFAFAAVADVSTSCSWSVAATFW
jgi:hypothetical protein